MAQDIVPVIQDLESGYYRYYIAGLEVLQYERLLTAFHGSALVQAVNGSYSSKRVSHFAISKQPHISEEEIDVLVVDVVRKILGRQITLSFGAI